MSDVTPAVDNDRTRSADRWADVLDVARTARFTAVFSRPAVAAPMAVRRSMEWSDLPSGAGGLSEVRRRLRELQVQRAGLGRGLAA